MDSWWAPRVVSFFFFFELFLKYTSNQVSFLSLNFSGTLYYDSEESKLVWAIRQLGLHSFCNYTLAGSTNSSLRPLLSLHILHTDLYWPLPMLCWPGHVAQMVMLSWQVQSPGFVPSTAWTGCGGSQISYTGNSRPAWYVWDYLKKGGRVGGRKIDPIHFQCCLLCETFTKVFKHLRNSICYLFFTFYKTHFICWNLFVCLGFHQIMSFH